MWCDSLWFSASFEPVSCSEWERRYCKNSTLVRLSVDWFRIAWWISHCIVLIPHKFRLLLQWGVFFFYPITGHHIFLLFLFCFWFVFDSRGFPIILCCTAGVVFWIYIICITKKYKKSWCHFEWIWQI